MKDRFLPTVILRFLFRSQSIGVLPWLTSFALLSVAVGVATLILVLSVMNGFSATLQQQLVGIYSPIRLFMSEPGYVPMNELKQQIDNHADVTDVVGVIEGEVLLKSGSAQYQGGRIMAFSRWREDRLPVRQPPEEGVILGHQLARDLWALPGENIVVIRPDAQQTPFGMLPGGVQLPVQDSVRTGFQPLDQYLALVSWKQARELFDVPEGRASYVEIWIQDRFRSEQVKQELQKRLPDRYSFTTWQESSPALFEALKLERTVTFLILALIVGVASVNILSMLVLTILQRRQQIAMMMAMGASPRTILGIFLAAGLLITELGLAVGFGVGLGGCYLLDNVFPIQLPPVYPMTHLPVDVEPTHLLAIGAVTTLLGLLSSMYPAWVASRIDPAEVLRYG